MILLKAVAVAVAVILAPAAPANHYSVRREQAFARSITHAGRSGRTCLRLLWDRESGWNPWAVNVYSGAYGIPQALPAAQGNPYPLGAYKPQIRWGIRYIRHRYGHACTAWLHEQEWGWY